MERLSLGIVGTSRKPDERRLPIHPDHLERIDSVLRARISLERGYACAFGVPDERIAKHVGGLRSREELFAACDVVVVPKPSVDDLNELPPGGVLWGWPHSVQQEAIAQAAIDRRLTLIAWEGMHYWTGEGRFRLHVFHRNNELAGYCAVLHALQLSGSTGAYGRELHAAVIGFGSAGRGALRALVALGIRDVAVLTQHGVPAVAEGIPPARLVPYERDPGDPSRVMVLGDWGNQSAAEFLAEYDVVVNCVLQDTDAPLMFVTGAELGLFSPGSLVVDVSADECMGFSWARPTSFAEPTFTVGPGVRYYAVDHAPSYLWNAATWEISEALIPFLAPVMAGTGEWEANETIRRAIDIQDGRVKNAKILTFQSRSPDFPYPKV